MDEEMRQPEEMVSVIDGKKVQEILVGRYLNVVIVDHTDFMKLMLKEDYRIRHNFMMLIGQWFICLSSSSEWDERNEGSVKLSCKLKPELSKTNLWPWVTYGDSAPNEVSVSGHQTESVERLFAAYLSKTEWEICNPFRQFLVAMQKEDRTLQQILTRFAVEWCDWVVKEEKEIQRESYRIASLIASVPSVLL